MLGAGAQPADGEAQGVLALLRGQVLGAAHAQMQPVQVAQVPHPEAALQAGV